MCQTTQEPELNGAPKLWEISSSPESSSHQLVDEFAEVLEDILNQKGGLAGDSNQLSN